MNNVSTFKYARIQANSTEFRIEQKKRDRRFSGFQILPSASGAVVDSTTRTIHHSASTVRHGTRAGIICSLD